MAAASHEAFTLIPECWGYACPQGPRREREELSEPPVGFTLLSFPGPHCLFLPSRLIQSQPEVLRWGAQKGGSGRQDKGWVGVGERAQPGPHSPPWPRGTCSLRGPKEAPSVPRSIKGRPPAPRLDLGCLDGHRRVGDRQGKGPETPRCLARRPERRCQWRPDKQVTQSQWGRLWPQGLSLQTQHPANGLQELGEVKAISS